MGAHEQALLAQAQQSAACNATHVIESRLSRWLLRAADLHGGDELPLTQEYIAQMLGVRRTSVTVVARTLQEAGHDPLPPWPHQSNRCGSPSGDGMRMLPDYKIELRRAVSSIK